MKKFTKKVLSIAIASFVSMTSIFGSTSAKAADTTTKASVTDNTLTTEFTAPDNWNNGYIYAYAYYVDSANKKHEPLGCWPGTKVEQKDGKYNVSLESTMGYARVIFVNVKEKDVSEIKHDPYQNADYREIPKDTPQLPLEDNDPKTEDGFLLTKDTALKSATARFVAPDNVKNLYAYAYYTDSEGKLQEPLGYWPGKKIESNTNTYEVSVLSPTGQAKFIFTDIKEEVKLDASNLKTSTVSGGKYYEIDPSKYEQYPKDDGKKDTENGFAVTGETSLSSTTSNTTTSLSTPQPIVTPEIIVTPTVTPTITPTITPTVTPTIVPTVTPTAVAEVTPTIVPTVTPTAIPTVEPTIEPTVEPTVEPTIEPTVIPTVEPTATVEPTVEPTIEPTVIPTVVPTATPDNLVTGSALVPMPAPTMDVSGVIPSTSPVVTGTAIPTGGAIIDDPGIPNAGVNEDPSQLKGSVSFDKTKKTVGETIKIKATANGGKGSYKYTYYVTKGNKRITIASNSKKKSVDWTPDKAGKYTVLVKVKDASGKTISVKKTYTVKAAVVTISKFKTSKKSGQKVKTKITVSANAKTKTGKVSYKFAVKQGNGKIKVLKNFSKKNKVTWKPAKKGTYTLYVYVKNGKGITVSKTKTFKVK